MAAPTLSGIHHLKVHVTDVRRSARWYCEVLGYAPAVEFNEQGQIVGYGLSHPRGGTLLTLRLDADRAAATVGGIYFEMGVPDKTALDNLAAHLDSLGAHHEPVTRTPVGWVLPGLRDPDGHEMRFYTDEAQHGPPTAERPIRMHDAGTPDARREPVDLIDLDQR